MQSPVLGSLPFTWAYVPQVVLGLRGDLSKEQLLGPPDPQHGAHVVEQLLPCVQVLLSGQTLSVAKAPALGNNGHLQGMGRCPLQAWFIDLSTSVGEETPRPHHQPGRSPRGLTRKPLHPACPEEVLEDPDFYGVRWLVSRPHLEPKLPLPIHPPRNLLTNARPLHSLSVPCPHDHQMQPPTG